MAGTSRTPSRRDRRLARAERQRAAERRRQQRRSLGFALAATAIVAVVFVLSSGLLGPDSGAGPIKASAARDVSVAGPARSDPLAVGDEVPSFSAPGFRMVMTGSRARIRRDPFDWATYAGSPTVLSIWASWCPHCQRELPLLADAVAGTPNVRLVTIVTSIGAHPGPTPSQYLAEQDLTFPVAIDDAEGTIAHAFGVEVFPTLYFVDASGAVTYASEGEVSSDVLRQQLERLS